MITQVTLKKVTRKSEDISKIKKLYHTAFPAEERAPFRMIVKKMKRPNVNMIGIYDKERFAGFFYVVTNKDLAYVFYFAINDEDRGKGIGTSALKELGMMYKDYRLFLAIEQLDPEADNYEERIKRRKFYEFAGFKDLHTKAREASVIYDLMGYGQDVKAEEYVELMHNWMSWIYRKIIPISAVEQTD